MTARVCKASRAVCKSSRRFCKTRPNPSTRKRPNQQTVSDAPNTRFRDKGLSPAERLRNARFIGAQTPVFNRIRRSSASLQIRVLLDVRRGRLLESAGRLFPVTTSEVDQ